MREINMADKNNSIVDAITQAEYLQKICKETPQITIGTQCGVGKYEFKCIGYRDNELVLEFQLVMDDKRSDCERIAYNLGSRCILTAAQFLYAYEYRAFA